MHTPIRGRERANPPRRDCGNIETSPGLVAYTAALEQETLDDSAFGTLMPIAPGTMPGSMPASSNMVVSPIRPESFEAQFAWLNRAEATSVRRDATEFLSNPMEAYEEQGTDADNDDDATGSVTLSSWSPATWWRQPRWQVSPGWNLTGGTVPPWHHAGHLRQAVGSRLSGLRRKVSLVLRGMPSTRKARSGPPGEGGGAYWKTNRPIPLPPPDFGCDFLNADLTVDGQDHTQGSSASDASSANIEVLFDTAEPSPSFLLSPAPTASSARSRTRSSLGASIFTLEDSLVLTPTHVKPGATSDDHINGRVGQRAEPRMELRRPKSRQGLQPEPPPDFGLEMYLARSTSTEPSPGPQHEHRVQGESNVGRIGSEPPSKPAFMADAGLELVKLSSENADMGLGVHLDTGLVWDSTGAQAGSKRPIRRLTAHLHDDSFALSIPRAI